MKGEMKSSEQYIYYLLDQVNTCEMNQIEMISIHLLTPTATFVILNLRFLVLCHEKIPNSL